MIKKIEKILKKIAMGGYYVSCVSFVFVMLLIVVDATMRKTVGSILGSYEIVGLGLICGVFASWGYTQTEHGHVRVSMFIMLLPNPIRMTLNGLGNFIGLIVTVALTYAAIIQANYSYIAQTSTGVLRIPMYPFYIVEALCIAVYALVICWDVVKSFAALKNKELSAEIQKDWL